MSQIYTQAQNVCVWLGVPDEKGRLAAAINQIRILSDSCKAITKRGTDQLQEPPPMSDVSEDWKLISALLDVPYWTRLWIIQEVTLAKDISIHCGYKHCSWENLISALVYSGTGFLDNNSPLLQQGTRHVVASLQTNRKWNLAAYSKKPTSILTLMHNYKDAQCFDIRDKVFGLHSLALPCCREAVPINYSLDKTRLFGMVMIHHCIHHDQKEVLSTILRGLDSKNDSWLCEMAGLSKLPRAELPHTFQIPIRARPVSQVIRTEPRYSITPNDSEISTWRKFGKASVLYANREYKLEYEKTKRHKGLQSYFSSISWLSDDVDGVDGVDGQANLLEEAVSVDCPLYYGTGPCIGFAPVDVRLGDLICVSGDVTPNTLIIRPEGKDFRLIGVCSELSCSSPNTENDANVVEISLTIRDLLTHTLVTSHPSATLAMVLSLSSANFKY
jgi:hypothetical protein